MKTIELLAPAGSMEACKAAIQNGCDAVYLGGPGFGARAFADNFDEAGLKQAVVYAHWYGVKVYVTVNTLIHEDELRDVIDYIRFLQSIDVDALIIQDLGLMDLVLRQFPEMEVHASTQMHVHNAEAIAFLQQQGVKRVVVPRETSLEELRELAGCGVDLEVFVQGALCVSYSGQCLMSSVLFDRSGNRGACAQPCRMQYELYRQDQGHASKVASKGEYLLSPKDLNVLSSIGELIDAGATSFKIEGRMKRPEYVAYVVSLYRQAIDAHVTHQHFQFTNAMLENMEKLFHRGFTKGHLYHQMGSALMNPIRPNHMGITIGTVTELKKDRMVIALTHRLDQGDGIRILHDYKDEGFRANFIYKNGLLVNHGEAKEVIELDRIMGIQKGAVVLKTTEEQQLKELQQTYEGYQRRISVQATMMMIKGIQTMLTLWDEDGHSTSVEGAIAEAAQRTPLSAERIAQQLHKTKDTPITITHIDYVIDEDATMPISELNRMRREAIEQLLALRSVRNGTRREVEFQEHAFTAIQEPSLHVIVHSEAQYQACQSYPLSIYVDGYSLYHRLRQQGAAVHYRNPRVRKEALVPGISQDVGGITTGMICDTALNVTNHLAANFLFAHGAAIVVPSSELDQEAIIQLAAHGGSYGYVVYGKRELMLSEYCVINAVEQDSDKKACGLCRQHSYYLQDRKQRRFPLLCDEQCRMHLLEETAEDHIHKISKLQKQGIHQFFCILTNEDQQESANILAAILKQLA